MNCPCKNCNRRTERCHSSCEEYRAFRKKSIEFNKKKFEQRETDLAIRGSNINRARTRNRNDEIFKTHRK